MSDVRLLTLQLNTTGFSEKILFHFLFVIVIGNVSDISLHCCGSCEEHLELYPLRCCSGANGQFHVSNALSGCV